MERVRQMLLAVRAASTPDEAARLIEEAIPVTGRRAFYLALAEFLGAALVGILIDPELWR